MLIRLRRLRLCNSQTAEVGVWTVTWAHWVRKFCYNTALNKELCFDWHKAATHMYSDRGEKLWFRVSFVSAVKPFNQHGQKYSFNLSTYLFPLLFHLMWLKSSYFTPPDCFIWSILHRLFLTLYRSYMMFTLHVFHAYIIISSKMLPDIFAVSGNFLS